MQLESGQRVDFRKYAYLWHTCLSEGQRQWQVADAELKGDGGVKPDLWQPFCRCMMRFVMKGETGSTEWYAKSFAIEPVACDFNCN